MVNQIFFVAGVHGTGKTTLCSAVKKHLKIPHYSCSAIINEQRNIKSDRSKIATNIDENQSPLTHYIQYVINEAAITLDGHFSLFTSSYQPYTIGYDVFDSMNINSILLLTCDPDVIVDRIFKRDLKPHPVDKIAELQNIERSRVESYCRERNIHLTEIDTTYGYDIEPILRQINSSLPKSKMAS